MLNTHTSCSSTIYITNGEPKMKFVVAVVRQATCSRRKFGFKQAIWKKKNADDKTYWVVSYNHKVYVRKDTLKNDK